MADGFFLGPIKIYYYSLCLLAAVWVGYGLALRQAKNHKLTANTVSDSIVLALISGVIGGRLVFVLQNLTYFSEQPGEILRITSGGLSIHGAILGGAFALWLFCRKYKLSFVKLTDALSLPLLAGQIIGRLGNYFNQELFGYPTNLPWAISIDPINRPAGYFSETLFHPVFAYEMILNAIGLAILWRLQPHFKKPGQLATAYLIVFAISRFIAEIFRISDRLFWNLSLAQVVSLALLLFLGLLKIKHHS